MAFLDLFYVASIPIVKVFLISGFGTFLATEYGGILTNEARRNLNKVVFVAFVPALMVASLAQSVTLEDLMSWWSMPINVFFTFFLGSVLGWIIVKITKPPPELHGLIISNCCAGNLGNLLLIVIPSMCQEKGNPFGDPRDCESSGTAYVSLSMALGSLFLWTYSYSIIRSSARKNSTNELEEGLIEKAPSIAYLNPETTHEPCSEEYLSKKQSFIGRVLFRSNQISPIQIWHEKIGHGFVDIAHLIFDELKAPPTLGVIIGFCVGAIPQVKNLFIGESAPLRVVQDSVSLLGEGTIPSVTLVMGGNLAKGLKNSKLSPIVVVLVIVAKFILLPMMGTVIVRGASNLHLLPDDPFFEFVLLMQYTVPPAMILGTMAQMFNVGEQECSVLLLWTYLVASLAMTLWSSFFMTLLFV